MKYRIILAAILSWPFFSLEARGSSAETLMDVCAAEIASARAFKNLCPEFLKAAKGSKNPEVKAVAAAVTFVNSMSMGGPAIKKASKDLRRTLSKLYATPEKLPFAIILTSFIVRDLGSGMAPEVQAVLEDVVRFSEKHPEHMTTSAKAYLRSNEAVFFEKTGQLERAGRSYDQAWALIKDAMVREGDYSGAVYVLSDYADFLDSTRQYGKLKKLLDDIEDSELISRSDLSNLDAVKLFKTLLDVFPLVAETEEDHAGSLRTLQAIVPKVISMVGDESFYARRFRQALAGGYQNAFRFREAEDLYLENFRLAQKNPNWPPSDIVWSITDLANFYKATNRISESIVKYAQALPLAEKAFGKESVQIATIYSDLAEAYQSIGDETLATGLAERAYSIVSKNPLAEASEKIDSRLTLAKHYQNSSNPKAALPLLELNLREIDSAYGEGSPKRIETLREKCSNHRSQGKFGLAADCYRDLIALIERHWMEADTAEPLRNLANAVSEGAMTNYAEALPILEKAIRVASARYPENDPTLLEYNVNLAVYLEAHGGPLEEVDRIVARAWQHLDEDGNERKYAYSFYARNALLLVLKRLREKGGENSAKQSFRFAQRLRIDETDAALRQALIKLSSSDAELIEALERKDTLNQKIGRLESDLIRDIGKKAGKDRDSARKNLENLGVELKIVDSVIRRKTVGFSEYLDHKPVEIGDLQALLREGEAVLVYRHLVNTLHVWLVSKSGFEWHAEDVPDLWDKVERAAASLRSSGGIPNPDVGLLNDLYGKLVGPVERGLEGVSHIFVVPDGNIGSLPHSVLVSKPAEQTGVPNYAEIDWLVRRFSISYLPQVSSLKVIRGLKPNTSPSSGFLGVGDPALDETLGNTRGSKPRTAESAALRSKMIMELGRLPDTAHELSEIANLYEKPETSLYLAAAATEKSLRSIDLRRYSTIAFATHGVLPGEVGDNVEAGLIFTPGPGSDESDDGFLGASDIGTLKLNADLIVLSACNTGVPDSASKVPSTFGLAKPFFHAGARSILATMWSIDSEATPIVTSGMLGAHRSGAAGNRAAALRNSVLKMIGDQNNPEFSNPYFWGAFVLIGDK